MPSATFPLSRNYLLHWPGRALTVIAMTWALQLAAWVLGTSEPFQGALGGLRSLTLLAAATVMAWLFCDGEPGWP